jgi:hypothetical protein
MLSELVQQAARTDIEPFVRFLKHMAVMSPDHRQLADKVQEVYRGIQQLAKMENGGAHTNGVAKVPNAVQVPEIDLVSQIENELPPPPSAVPEVADEDQQKAAEAIKAYKKSRRIPATPASAQG